MEIHVSNHTITQSGSALVAFSEHGVVEIMDQELLASVGAGGLFETEVNANGICGSEINTSCNGSNTGCVASPNTACGSNQVCSEVDSPV
jgi:hypothetical protein